MADLAGMDDAARAAYAAAQELIAEAASTRVNRFNLDGRRLPALTDIPPEISDLKRLISLELGGTKISDLSSIRDLTQLQGLYLLQTGVSDLSPLREMIGLQTLILNQTEVSDLSPIRGLAGLKNLYLEQTKVDDLSPIQGLSALQFLSIDQTKVSDLTPISGLLRLETLLLSQTRVDDLSPIHDLTGLQTLSLRETAVSDLSPIERLMGLESLVLSKTEVRDVSAIRNLTGLHTLFLDETEVSDLRPLVGMRNLGVGPGGGLWFSKTPAVRFDQNLERLTAITDDYQRAKETLAYLKTLPPWPEPLPWLAKDDSPPPQTPIPKPTRPDPPLTRAMAGPKTPAKHVKFLLSQPRLTEFTAKEVAGQIRWALKDVKRATNSLPEPLATIEEIADALDDLGNTRLGPKDKQRVQDLNLRIAQLEAVVEKLTAQLSDSEKARATAEALAKSQGFKGQFMSELATEAVKTGGFIVRTGAVGGVIYILGATSPIVAAMLGALAALK